MSKGKVSKRHKVAKEATDINVQDQNNVDLLFDIRVIIHFEFVPEGTAVNQAFYVEGLKRLIDAVRRKRREFWRDRSLILHHDNAPAHCSLRVSQFLAGKGISAMDHPPYSPELAQADFWLFPKLKSVLKGKRFSDVEDIKSSVKKILTDIPVQDFKNCFELLPKRWEHRK
jgi:histone-lysine N-methyltransferase SETMAR